MRAVCLKGHVLDEANTYISPKSQKRSCKLCASNRNKQEWRKDVDASRKAARLHMAKWRKANKKRDNQNWTELRKLKNAWIEQYKSEQQCSRCPENDPVCLDFHHRDPQQKEMTISLAIARASLERIKMEVAKCDILCANCHRKLHAAERAAEKVS